jgi:uncharacterized protein
MTTYQRPPKIDVKHAGQASQQLAGQDVLAHFERLMEETQGLGGQNPVGWAVRGALQTDAQGQPQPWLFLNVSTSLPLNCQRCLGPVDVPVQIERAFRFVETEAQAEQEDDESPEDVLVASREFDLAALIEDEVLMDLPVVPRHDTCPLPVKLTAVDPDFEEPSAKPSPFAVLAGLKGAGKL